MDYSPPGSSVHGIFQARILELVAISSARDLPNPWIKPVSCHLLHWQADSLPLHHLGSPVTSYSYLINHSIPNVNNTKSFRACITAEKKNLVYCLLWNTYTTCWISKIIKESLYPLKKNSAAVSPENKDLLIIQRWLPDSRASLLSQTVKRLPAMRETRVLSPGSGRSPGEGNGNPLQYSCLENSMDRGA